MMDFNKVIELIKISNIVIPNSIVFPVFQTNFATPYGFVTERLTRMYEKISNIIENKADLVSIGRPQLADPDFFNKSINKQQISEYNYYGTCLYFAIGADPIACPLNPEF